MLISEKLAHAMNEQIGRELGASNQYVNIATYFDSESLPELAAFFYRQADEERMHAMKFVHYIVESAEHAAKLSLEWELEVTDQINTLMNMAIEEKDHIAQDFLRWFVNEQLEEVSTMDELLAVIRRAGESGLLFVEEYLVRRGDPHAGEGEE
jgi:ferritin